MTQLSNDQVRALRTAARNITAPPALVRATQLRVRERAARLREEEERMSPLWIASGLAAIWALLSAPFLWYGFEWVGTHTGLNAVVVQTLFIFAWLMPTGLIVALTVWWKGVRVLAD